MCQHLVLLARIKGMVCQVQSVLRVVLDGRCATRDGVRARRHTADASKASRQSHLTASPVYESSEGGEESAYADRMTSTCARRVVRRVRMHAEHGDYAKCV
jgi:hypothetical protein